MHGTKPVQWVILQVDDMGFIQQANHNGSDGGEKAEVWRVFLQTIEQ